MGDASVIFHEFLYPGRVQPVNQRSFAGNGELVLAQDSPSIAGVEFFHRGIRSDGNLADFLSPRPSRGGRPDQDAFKPVLSENGFGIDISGKAGQYALVAEILEGKNGGARSDEDDGGNEQGEDVNEKLYVLSTYLGHVKPADTFWYLSATPELLKALCSKYEEQFGGNDDEI